MQPPHPEPGLNVMCFPHNCDIFIHKTQARYVNVELSDLQENDIISWYCLVGVSLIA